MKKVDDLKSQGLDEDELNKQLELLKVSEGDESYMSCLDDAEIPELGSQNLSVLQESYTILSTVEERRLYDWSLSRSERPDRYAWPFEDDITQISTRQPPPPVMMTILSFN